MQIDRHQTDILIIGTGGAGLFAALHAKQANPDLDITLAVKGLVGKCGCTRMVQGGYNVALSAGDSIERHFMDTIVGGKWLPRQDLAWRLCETAVERIQELENEIARCSSSLRVFAAQTFSISRLMISIPVRSALCAVRSKLCPAKAFWCRLPSGLRSKKQPISFSSS